jgi:hypothetical protein
MRNKLNIADCRNRRRTCLPFLRAIETNHTSFSILFTIDCKSFYYVENLTTLCRAVCRERPELWTIFGYIKLSVEKDCGHQLAL